MPHTDRAHTTLRMFATLVKAFERFTLSWPQLLLPAIVVGIVLVVIAVAFGIWWRHTTRMVRNEHERGEELSGREARPDLPLTCVRADGSSADPLNIQIVGSAEQLSSALVAAGWFRADEVTPVTSMRIVLDTILARQYPTAPVSDLYLFGRRQDYAFQYPGRDVRERDHVRLWKTDITESDGRPLWVGAATRDIAVKYAPGVLLPTHQISPKVDDERDFLVETLAETGWISDVSFVPTYGRQTISDNGFGDVYITDGMAVLVILADVPALLPFTDKVRGPMSGVARTLSRTLRWRLPSGGRERIAAARRALAQRTRARGQRTKEAGITPAGRELDDQPNTKERGEAGSPESSKGS